MLRSKLWGSCYSLYCNKLLYWWCSSRYQLPQAYQLSKIGLPELTLTSVPGTVPHLSVLQWFRSLSPCLAWPCPQNRYDKFWILPCKKQSHLSYHHTGLTYTLALTDITLRVVWRGSVPVEQQWSTWFWNSLTARINWDPPASHYTSVARGTLHPSWLVIACYL